MIERSCFNEIIISVNAHSFGIWPIRERYRVNRYPEKPAPLEALLPTTEPSQITCPERLQSGKETSEISSRTDTEGRNGDGNAVWQSD